MTCEILKGVYTTTAGFPEILFDMATFFSGGVNFNIIDSYSPSSTPNRYKGDPIADSVWLSSSDIGSNAWFIIQCQSYLSTQHSLLTKWECKIQQSYSGAFYDPSTPDYGFEGSSNRLLHRFSPYGGWDLEDTNPDFSPGGGKTSSDNHDFALYAATTLTYWYVIVLDGMLCVINRTGRDYAGQGKFYRMTSFFGDFNPVNSTSQSFPRCSMYDDSYAQLKLSVGISASSIRPEDTYVTTNAKLEYENDSNVWTTSTFSVPSGSALVNQYTKYNQYSGEYEIDTLPYFLSPTSFGIIGDIPMITRGYGIGSRLLNNKNWLSAFNDHSVFFKWDGSTIV